MTVACLIHACSRQPDLYLYLREGFEPEQLPAALLARVGRLKPVMRLELDAERRLARADAASVIAALQAQGYYLQLPPGGAVDPRLNFGGG